MNGITRFFIALFVIILLSPLAANAYGSHGYHGYYRGGIWISPWVVPYPYPYYSDPPVVIQEPATEYYVQPAPQQPQEPAYWYFCKKPEGYYPYVKQCPEGWMKVVPTPPAQK